MVDAVAEYALLVSCLGADEGVALGQMFGKACIKIHGKAFVSQHKDAVVFKLTGAHHQQAMALDGAALWDPSGKGRPMKEWVALPVSARAHFRALADAARTYVAGAAAST